LVGGLGGDNWSESGYVHNFLKYSLNENLVAIDDTGVRVSGTISLNPYTFWQQIGKR